MAVKRFGANHVLGIAMIAWSVITLATGFIQNYSQAIAVRVLLGAFEAGLVPSVVFIISTIWERERQSKRVAIIYGCNCLSGAFGGLIAVSCCCSESLMWFTNQSSMELRAWAQDMDLSPFDGYSLSKEPFQSSCVEYAGLYYPKMPRQRGS
jgi:MFS family permease